MGFAGGVPDWERQRQQDPEGLCIRSSGLDSCSNTEYDDFKQIKPGSFVVIWEVN